MDKADLILTNATLHTGTAKDNRARSLAIRNGRILALSKATTQPEFTGDNTRIIDCQSATVLPGFNDAHCHLFSCLWQLLGVDCGPAAATSIADISDIIRCQAKKTPAGEWITATGYNDFYLKEGRHPNRHDLDKAAPNHPVCLVHRSLHACVLNSLGLALAGIDNFTEAPAGAVIDREINSGEPSGLLLEMLGDIRGRVLPKPDNETFRNGLHRLNEQFLSCGITSLQDATYTNDYHRWQFLKECIGNGLLNIRVGMMVNPDTSDEFTSRGMATGYGDTRLRLGAAKFMVTETEGGVFPAPEDLATRFIETQGNGFQIAAHAVTESCVAAAISALESLPASSGFKYRHRIEHCSECPPKLVARLHQSHISVVSQPPFVFHNGERYLATVPAEKQRWLYPFRSWLENGINVAASSDCPVVTPEPLVGIHAAVNRMAASGQTLLPSERVEVTDAIQMYTRNAARTTAEENLKGSLVPGQLADLAVLAENPAAVPPDQIKDIAVMMTIIGGKVVWES